VHNNPGSTIWDWRLRASDLQVQFDFPAGSQLVEHSTLSVTTHP
jgi:hypothetical protein